MHTPKELRGQVRLRSEVIRLVSRRQVAAFVGRRDGQRLWQAEDADDLPWRWLCALVCDLPERSFRQAQRSHPVLQAIEALPGSACS